MNVFQALKRDHQEIKDLFSRFKAAGERAHKRKQTIAQQAIQEIRAHSRAEEKVFYAALKERGNEKMQDKVLEGIEEHRTAEFVMRRLGQTAPADETFDAKFKVLTELVKDHIKEEEQEMFPQARKLLREDQDEMGVKFERLERRIKGG